MQIVTKESTSGIGTERENFYPPHTTSAEFRCANSFQILLSLSQLFIARSRADNGTEATSPSAHSQPVRYDWITYSLLAATSFAISSVTSRFRCYIYAHRLLHVFGNSLSQKLSERKQSSSARRTVVYRGQKQYAMCSHSEILHKHFQLQT